MMLRKTILGVLAVCSICFVTMGISSFVSAFEQGSVGFSLIEQHSAMPGEYVTLVATFRNAGVNEETFHVSIEEPVGWGVLSLQEVLLLPPGAEELLFITLSVPSNALASQYLLTVNASSQTGILSTQSAVVEVVRKRELALVPSDMMQLLPGDSALHSVTVYNRGNAVERIRLNISPPDGWQATSDFAERMLNPGTSQTVLVALTVPREARSTYSSIIVDAVSTDGQIQVSTNLGVTVLPPTPALVRTLGPDTLSARFYATTGDITDAGLRIGNAGFIARGTIGEDTKIDLNGRISAVKSQQSYRGNLDLTIEKLPWSFGFSLVPEATNITQHRYLLGYDQDPWSLRLGDVDQRISPLVKIRGRGATVDYFDDYEVTYSLIALDQAVGTSISKTWGPTDWRFTYLYRGEESGHVLSAHSEIQLTDNVGIDGEVALMNGSTSAALGANWQNGDFSADGHYFWYGDGHFNVPGDSRGYELNFAADFEKMPLTLSIEKTRESVTKDDHVLATENKTISLDTSIPLGNLNLDAFIQGAKKTTWPSATVPPSNVKALDTKVILNQRVSNWSWEISNETKAISDDIDGDREANIATKAIVYYHWDCASAYFGYGLVGQGVTLTKAKDNMYPALLLGIFHYPETQFVDYTSLDYQGGAHPVLTLRNQVGVDINNARLFLRSELKHKEKWEWDVRAGLTVRFDLPVLGVYSKGQIRGRIFVAGGPASAGVGEVVLKTGSTRVSTDADGYFKFPPLKEGVYEITIENLPANNLMSPELPLEVAIIAGETVELEIPINQVASISGSLRAEPSSVSPYSTVPNMAGAVLELKQAGKVIQTTRTTSDGYYQFWNLEPGLYELNIIENTLPKRYKLAIINPVEVDLKPTERVRVNFDIKEELNIVITFKN